MTFKKIQPEKVANAVQRQIEQLILRGVLRPGERLPSERDLAEQMGVSRPSLRDAVARLQADGLLTTRAGAGIFVADFHGNAFSEPLVRLFATHDEAAFDYIAFRRDLEGIAAARAAELASDTDLMVIDSIYQKMAQANRNADTEAEVRLDAEFHMAIYEAGHNVVMLHMMRAMAAMLHQGVFFNRRAMFGNTGIGEQMLAQHAAINAAIQKRDSQTARQAVESHMDFVADALRKSRTVEQNEETARLKYLREAGE